LGDLDQTAQALLSYGAGDRIWVFQGDLGAGKTTVIQAVAKAFGVEDRVSSPTFSMVNEYRNHQGDIFYHFDFYRLEDPAEAFEIGVDEYFFSGHYCWIEWAEKIPGFVPEDFFHIFIDTLEDGSRKLTLRKVKNGQADG
jgi:tRNA threonylcarbamoyladenosine biosynthesis protein TsaE